MPHFVNKLLNNKIEDCKTKKNFMTKKVKKNYKIKFSIDSEPEFDLESE